MSPNRTNPFPGRPARDSARVVGAFTLVEVLIAISILSMVVVAIFSTWTAILRASALAREESAAVQRVRIAGWVLENSLTSLQFFSANQQYYGFIVDNTRDGQLSFVAHLDPSFPRSGKFGGSEVRRLVYSVEADPAGGDMLVLRQCPLVLEMDKDEQEHPLVLMHDVTSFRTEFYDIKLDQWKDEWVDTNQIPSLVRVSIKTREGRFSEATSEIQRIVQIPSSAVPAICQVPKPGFKPLQ